MKTLLAVLAMAALGGCAVAPPAYYSTSRTQVVDPYQWHTVSVLPAGQTYGSAQTSYTTEELPTTQSRVVYTTEPVYAAPVYVTQPLYAPAPAYYYPPVTIGLDFAFGSWCCGHRGGRGYYRHR